MFHLSYFSPFGYAPNKGRYLSLIIKPLIQDEYKRIRVNNATILPVDKLWITIG